MHIKLMRKLDFFIGVPLCCFLACIKVITSLRPHKPKSSPDAIKKVLVIKFLGIGSIVLTAPAIAAIKDEFPGAEIYYLTFKSNKEIIDLLNLTRKNFYIDTKTISSFCITAIQTVLKLRKEKIDLMLDFEFFSKLPLIIGALGKIKNRAGFYLIVEWWRKHLLTCHGYYNHYYHVKDIFLSLVYLVKYKDPYYVEFGSYQKKYGLPILFPVVDTLEQTKKIIKDAGMPAGNLLIAINPNAGPELAPHLKRWPSEYFVELIDRINERYNNIFVVLTGSGAERSYVQTIADRVKEKTAVNNIAGRTNLTELAGLLSCAKLFITVDSGPMHLAALIRTPTIGLFGAETPMLYGPLNEQATVLCKPLYSIPMFTVYNGKESTLTENIPLRLITVEDVFRTVEEHLDKHPNICTASFAKQPISSKSA